MIKISLNQFYCALGSHMGARIEICLVFVKFRKQLIFHEKIFLIAKFPLSHFTYSVSIASTYQQSDCNYYYVITR